MNELKRKWAAGQSTINGWLSTGDSFAAEIMAASGFDSLTVDMQHGFLEYSHAMGAFQAMRASGVVPMARVPWREPGIVMKALDAGALGIICPMVNSRAEAEELVSFMRYPPHGTRSFGPTRASYHHGAGYFDQANEEVLAIAMIETGTAVDNVEEICATPGLDGIYIGPSDLTLGVTQGRLPPGLDREEEDMIATIRAVLDVARRNGLRAGIHCGAATYAARACGWGFDFATVGSDAAFMAAGARAAVTQVRQDLGQDLDRGAGGDAGAASGGGY